MKQPENVLLCELRVTAGAFKYLTIDIARRKLLLTICFVVNSQTKKNATYSGACFVDNTILSNGNIFVKSRQAFLAATGRLKTIRRTLNSSSEDNKRADTNATGCAYPWSVQYAEC